MNHFAAIREKLSEYGIDAMLLTCEANRFYASGFHSTGTDGAALVTKDETYYWTDSRYIEAAQQQVKGAKVEMTTTGHGYTAFLNEAVERHGLRTIGFEDEYMTVAELKTYQEKVAKAEFKPATKLLTALRTVKDPEEIEALIGAQRIAEKALADICTELKAGMTEKDVAARLTYLMLHYGAENMSFDPIVASGANGSKPHAVPSEKVIEAGDFVTMDFGCIYHGYCSDMTRTVAIGHVTEEMDKVYHIVLNAQLAGIAAAKAGVPGCDVHNAAAKVIADAGYGEYFGHGFGHGVGVEIHESPRASATWKEPLPAGAVISAEPGIYMPGKFGVRIEDCLIVKEGGCEIIHKAPKELLIL
jgi:Xaa-Pro aminopeptidase